MEHDACGVGMVVNIHGNKGHELVDKALKVLENMEHRGAETSDKTGDGAGILLQIPHEFILLQGVPVPEKGKYGTGLVFLPKDEHAQEAILSVMNEEISGAGLCLLHVRTVPTCPEVLGEGARSVEPCIKQVFITEVGDTLEKDEMVFRRKLYVVRKRIERRVVHPDFYVCSLSNTSIIYKGMLTSSQLRRYFPDLSSPHLRSGIALVHSRFSTNTFPTWSLAQPFRLLAHNGEINTIRGNRGWMKARESVLNSESLGDVKAISPIVEEGMSDSASLDNVLEFLLMSGMSLPQALSILVPESFNEKNPISADLKAFYEYHSILMEPWDGPAALLFSDGRYAGGMLDRNGLRPSRYTLTRSGMLVVASEVGVMDFEVCDVLSKGRLEPGKILLVDTDEGRIYYDGELKEELAKAHPYREWLQENRVELETLKSGRKVENSVSDLEQKLLLFGYGLEDIERTIVPMATTGQEPVAAMGNDTPLAVVSDRPQLLFNYFRQQFAQVTNPAIDPIREELVMSLTEYIGAVGTNILRPDASNCKMVRLPQPVLTNGQLDILCNIRYKGFRTKKLGLWFEMKEGTRRGTGGHCGTEADGEGCTETEGDALRKAIEGLCKAAERAVDDGVNYLILSDKEDGGDPEWDGQERAVIPSLLAVSAVHHYLIGVGKRVQTALIVESGEIRETMHAALLLGYGASALCPYMVYAILDDLVKRGKIQEEYGTAERHYIQAVDKGLKKIMSKMGISTIRSYRGAKIFESIGLCEALLQEYFGTEVSTIGGIGLQEIARDAINRSLTANPSRKGVGNSVDEVKSVSVGSSILKDNGQFSWRKDGIEHAWTPETIYKLQLATRRGDYRMFKEWSALVDDVDLGRDVIATEKTGRGMQIGERGHGSAGEERVRGPIFLRDFLGWKRGQKRVALEEVEPVESIVKHFVTGAMSFGALSKEAHEALALAMNKLGTRSNTGEGGEDNTRYHSEVDGISLCSKTKQVASGRFGVTTEYLVNAEEIQIKVAQGAKPGEGGQLPGFKVNEVIAKTRNAIPGISLISPPPHHDIYSIEDLAQLIFDLKNVNPTAAVSVKLVAESGVGTIAAGVAKAKADLIVISGAEGGTGASPASSMRFAGISPEIGLSETQQTLVKNGLRGLVRLQTDGQLKTAKDVIIMAMLGADEFGFGTLPLIVLGCVMMRKCNTNTCPMGVATQNPELRKHFEGRSEWVVNYFTMLAQQVREYLSEIGVHSLEELIGHAELIEVRIPGGKTAGHSNGTERHKNAMERQSEVIERCGQEMERHSEEIERNHKMLDKWRTIDFGRLLHILDTDKAFCWEGGSYTKVTGVKDEEIIEAARKAIYDQEEVTLEYTIKNTDRAVGTMLSGVIAKEYGEAGLPDGSINLKFKGSAGQSFGAFAVHGLSIRLEGECNDYFGKGLSGGRISILPPSRLGEDFHAEENIIAGNTGLYGATSGELYVNGKVGERFGVRNSGATAVIEGAGDHCCEYMTGGRVVVLGETGRNFAAGMSGGVAYVYDPRHSFDYFCNMDMVEINLVEDGISRKELLELVRQHYLHTGSALAGRMLDDWNHYLKDFVQVVPIEYKRVLQEEQMKKLHEKIADIQRDY